MLEEIFDLHSYCDADWAADLRTRRSTGGYVVYAMYGPVAWSSKLMSTVAASTMESEYMSAYPCGQEVIFIRNLIEELKFVFLRLSPFFMDAQAALQALKTSCIPCKGKT